MKDDECMSSKCLNGDINQSCFLLTTFSVAILYIMTSQASLRLSS